MLKSTSELNWTTTCLFSPTLSGLFPETRLNSTKPAGVVVTAGRFASGSADGSIRSTVEATVTFCLVCETFEGAISGATILFKAEATSMVRGCGKSKLAETAIGFGPGIDESVDGPAATSIAAGTGLGVGLSFETTFEVDETAFTAGALAPSTLATV